MEAVTHKDPKQAIVAKIAQLTGTPVGKSPPSAGGWRSAILAGGGWDADPATVCFVKGRGIRGHQVHFVTFKTRAGDERTLVIGVVQDSDGNWDCFGGAGGSGRHPHRERPWVNLGGWGWPRFLCAGGAVVGKGSEAAARVRLRLADGTVLEDSVDHGVVLFISEAPIQLPATGEILDAAGLLLASQEVFPSR